MARKINKIEAHATHPTSQIKKCAAVMLIRRALAVWVVENVTLKMLPIREVSLTARTVRLPISPKPYIPERLPPVDIPGVHFQEPQSATWREQHRSVVFA